MPKINIPAAAIRTTSIYPPEFQNAARERHKTLLGDAGGLTQFGVNLVRLGPDGSSALRHWHEREDEFIYVLEGEIVLVEDSGETLLRAGDAAGFKAGTANGHHLQNRSGRDAVYLEVGTRSAEEVAHYTEVDLILVRDAQGVRFLRRSGEPYSPKG